MANLCKILRGFLLRKRVIVLQVSPLTVAFNSIDATLLCLGGIMGHGFHVSLGNIAYKYGIMSFFSFALGGLLMIATAMCYAELSSLSPTAGNAYHYSYNTMGELTGFLVGWTMIMSNSLGLIVSSRYLSSFIDHFFFEGKIESALRGKLTTHLFEDYRKINTHPDIVSIIILLMVAGLTISMVRDSIIVTAALVGINLITITLILVIYLLSINYAKTKENIIPQDISSLAFMFDGAFWAHYCYSGYDVVVCLGEETENPTVTIPKSLLIACKLSIIMYCSVALLHCLAWPSNDTDPKGPFIYTMSHLTMYPGNWVCALGGLVGHLSSAYACMFLLIRLLYTMSRDGLLFSIFGQVNRNTNTPVASIFIFTVLLGSLGMYLETAYIWVLACATGDLSKQVIAICVLIRRYRCEDKLRESDPKNRWILFNYPRSLQTPSKVTEQISMLLIGNAVLCMLATSKLFTIMVMDKGSFSVVRYGFLVCIVLFFLLGYLLSLQPQNSRDIYYTVRGVPFLPLSLIGIYEVMISNFEYYPWKEILIWLFFGFIYYLIYSYRHSVERLFLYRDGERWSRLQSSRNIERHITYLIPDPADPSYVRFLRKQKRKWEEGRFISQENPSNKEEMSKTAIPQSSSDVKPSLGSPIDRTFDETSSGKGKSLR